MKNMYKIKFSMLIIFIVSGIFYSCNEEDNSLAPYAGPPVLSNIIVQEGSFRPEVTWVGGYVSVFGVNRGNRAALDSSLVWLIHTSSDQIGFPVVFGQMPEGAQDITSQYGGVTIDSLAEDEEYTFWMLKSDVWNQVNTQLNKEIVVDSSAGSSVIVSDTTVNVNPHNFTRESKSINVYINIVNLRLFGPLADISVESTTQNIPLIRWRIKAAGITDTLVAAIGMARGQVYDVSNALWEMYSIRDSSGVNIYARDNVIQSPIIVGEDIPGTRTFVVYAPENLQRNVEYMVWIADKTWDRVNRQRFTPGYAYALFIIE